MATGNPYIDQYRKSAVSTATPLQLVIMLYDGALRFIEAGKAAMAEGDVFKQNSSLQKAEKIVGELMACLDLNEGGEIAHNLLALYNFVYTRLVEANVDDKPEYLDQCIKVLSDLRASWVEIDGATRRGSEVQDAA